MEHVHFWHLDATSEMLSPTETTRKHTDMGILNNKQVVFLNDITSYHFSVYLYEGCIIFQKFYIFVIINMLLTENRLPKYRSQSQYILAYQFRLACDSVCQYFQNRPR